MEKGTVMQASEIVTRKVTVMGKEGLHMRPAAELARLCHEFDGCVRIWKGNLSSQEEVADAKNIIEILCLAAKPGEALTLEANGRNAGALLDRLCDVLASYGTDNL